MTVPVTVSGVVIVSAVVGAVSVVVVPLSMVSAVVGSFSVVAISLPNVVAPRPISDVVMFAVSDVIVVSVPDVVMVSITGIVLFAVSAVVFPLASSDVMVTFTISDVKVTLTSPGLVFSCARSRVTSTSLSSFSVSFSPENEIIRYLNKAIMNMKKMSMVRKVIMIVTHDS